MRVTGDDIAGIFSEMMSGRFMAMMMTVGRARSRGRRRGRFGGRRRVVTHVYYLLLPSEGCALRLEGVILVMMALALGGKVVLSVSYREYDKRHVKLDDADLVEYVDCWKGLYVRFQRQLNVKVRRGRTSEKRPEAARQGLVRNPGSLCSVMMIQMQYFWCR